jgi:hypothetical protein
MPPLHRPNPSFRPDLPPCRFAWPPFFPGRLGSFCPWGAGPCVLFKIFSMSCLPPSCGATRAFPHFGYILQPPVGCRPRCLIGLYFPLASLCWPCWPAKKGLKIQKLFGMAALLLPSQPGTTPSDTSSFQVCCQEPRFLRASSHWASAHCK